MSKIESNMKPKNKYDIKTERKPKQECKNDIKTESKQKQEYKNDIKTECKPKQKYKNNIKTGSKVLKSCWKILSKIITIAIIFVSAIIVVQKVTNNEESFFGYRIFRVQTGSMIPKYQIGDVILVKETNPDNIKIGDDVTYQGTRGAVNGLLVTHRVIDIGEENGHKVFHTQGIANNQEDPTITGEQINGVVQTKMYILTLICVLLNNKYVFYFCGILPLTIYVAFRLFGGKNVKRYEREN